MNRFLQNTPFFRLTIALAIGILAAICNAPDWAVYIVFAFGTIALISFFLLKNDNKKFRYNWLFGTATFLVLISLGAFLTQQQLSKAHFPVLNRQGTFTAKIIEQPIEKPRSTMCHVQILAFQDSLQKEPLNARSILYLEKDSLSLALQRGDVLLLNCQFTEPQSSNNPYAFNYKKYLARKGIGATAYCPSNSWQLLTTEPDHSPLAIAEMCRTHLLNIYKRFGIEGNEFGMLAALTLGYKDALSPELRESFSTTGAMHVLAVSGLHVGIIFVVLGLFLKPLGKGHKSKVLKNLLIIAFLWTYAFITGLSPSVCRATLMFSLVALANILQRQSSIYNTIFFSAFVLLLLKPTYLLEVGFQLSYCAVLSIVYFQPRLSSLWHPQSRLLKWCGDLACVSLVAQVGTAPFAMYYFHQFPNYFLLSNFIVIPAASVIIYLAIALFLTSYIPFVGAAIAFLLNWVLKLLYWSISGIEHLPNALSTLWISPSETFLLYTIVIASMIFCERKNFASLATTLTLTLIFFSSQLYRHHADFTQQEVVVFEHNKANVINFISGCENIVITNDTAEARRLPSTFWLKKRAPEPTFVPDTTLHATALVCNNERYLCLTRAMPRRAHFNPPLKTDYLIIGRKIFVDSTLFSNTLKMNNVIAPQCVPYYTAKRIKTYAERLGIPYSGRTIQ